MTTLLIISIRRYTEETAAMIKTLTFALVHIMVAFTVVYAMTGNVIAGGLIALIEPACNTVAYHCHEKFWDVIRQRRQVVGEPAVTFCTGIP